jgi:hypothetical protein
MAKARSVFLAMFMLLFLSTPATAVPTHITVRVKTKDAKFMGTGIGGALVTIKDAQTGELLAEGVTEGTSGNTQLIMKTPKARGVPISDQDAAKFEATLDIDEPRYVEVTAYGPLSQRQSANKASATQWVVPGKHINAGDAWMIELSGLLVEVQSPSNPTQFRGVPREVKIQAHVAMQ